MEQEVSSVATAPAKKKTGPNSSTPPRKRRTPKSNPNPDPARSAQIRAGWEGEKGEQRRAKIKAHPERYSRRGVPDGMTKQEAERLWETARYKAWNIMNEMEDQEIVPRVVIPDSDEDKAKRVLEEAMILALGPLTNAQVKMAAIRTVLDFTKSKPVQKTAVAVGSAEDWLREVLSDSGDGKHVEGSTSPLLK